MSDRELQEYSQARIMVDPGVKSVVRVKEEGVSAVWTKRGYAEPIFSTTPDMLPRPLKRGYNRSEFAEKYGLCYTGMNPKLVRCPRDCSEKDVVALFGPYVGKNGLNYMACGDEELVTYVERLWMIIHQKPKVLASHIITKGMVRAVYLEKKMGKKLNWATQAEWTSAEQWRRRQKRLASGLAESDDEEDFDCLDGGDGGEDGGSSQSKVSQVGVRQTSSHVFESSSAGPRLIELRVLWQEYESFTRALRVEAELALDAKKKEMDTFEIAEVRARGQLDLVRDQLTQAEKKLETLVAQMETRRKEGKFVPIEGVQCPHLEILTRQIDTQRCVIEVFRSSLEEKGAEFDKVRQGDGGVTNVMEVLREEAIRAASHNEAAKTLCVRLEKGSSIFRSIQPQPWLGL
jgi:hypothetical protein